MRCKECYSEDARKTPLLKPRECLLHHTQYVCSTCGRCICIEHTDKGLQRWMFPFRSFDHAMLYLRSADVSMQQPCGIYQITNESGRISFKIFADDTMRHQYQKHHPKRIISSCLMQFKEQMPLRSDQCRRLQEAEVEIYLQEQTSSTSKQR